MPPTRKDPVSALVGPACVTVPHPAGAGGSEVCLSHGSRSVGLTADFAPSVASSLDTVGVTREPPTLSRSRWAGLLSLKPWVCLGCSGRYFNRCGAILQSPVGNLESVISNRPSTIRNSQSTVGSLVLTYCYVSRRTQIPTPLRPRSSGYIWTGAGIGRRTSRCPNADGTRLHRPRRRCCGHLARHPRARGWGSRLGSRCGRLTMRSANTRGMSGGVGHPTDASGRC